MDASELELYKTQLAQATTALKSDPDNADLQNLKSELENLISLTQSLVESTTDVTSQAQHAGASQPAPRLQQVRRKGREKAQFTTGQEVLARYSADREFYPARIVAVAGDPASPTYTVVYKGYGNTDMVKASALKPIEPVSEPHQPPSPASSSGHPAPPPPPSSSTSDPPPPPPPADMSSTPSFGPTLPSDLAPHPPASPPPPPPPTSSSQPPTAPPMDDKQRKKYRNEKKLARREEKLAIQSSKAASWQKFANKKLKPISQSIFHTPESDPYARVGVTKSSSSSSLGKGRDRLG
ncbi:hypothetical protein NDA11_000012 [Ustilago hordei]|uniref:Tudor domain-containing protein n=1 Tax=Ustilago hordei TaxID=120017 RepID=I2FQN9_USTHO|nr:uncharacterized protein UHO2_05196 [Ustilago hordei]KAJ1042929.1 hypothetical protein NDA10_002138 [Ustilago hordei]KAJ1571347.1 hypothetical protein NDA12_007211 [Ustilago hordei]KAJ1571496.1 hypothetical protein NDA15_003936 [Ustilago hordei]KAJ1595943.1 hypothetical protein NDA11_000012 [Ustilago hordei]CCF49232.1 uncharacterized protein UHOR_07624 [Ustilago hordei]